MPKKSFDKKQSHLDKKWQTMSDEERKEWASFSLYNKAMMIIYGVFLFIGLILMKVAKGDVIVFFTLPSFDELKFYQFWTLVDDSLIKTILFTLGVGLFLGVAIFLVCEAIDTISAMSRRNRNMFARTIGRERFGKASLLILVAALGEECLFRGGLQTLAGPVLSIVVYLVISSRMDLSGPFSLSNLKAVVINFVLCYVFSATESLLIGIISQFIAVFLLYWRSRFVYSREGQNSFLLAGEIKESIVK